MKKLLTILIGLTAVLTAAAQMQDPIHFHSELKRISDTEAELLFQATIDAGWHVYSTGLGNNGPISATFHADRMEGAQTVGSLKARGKEVKQFDKMFGMEVRYFEQAVTFVQKIRFTQPRYDISCYIEYGACSDAMCLPPSSAELKVLASKKDSILANKDLWQPVVKELQAFGNKDITDTEISWWIIFFEGLLGGFLALFTPCVWPIIPMTVSFFLKRNKEQTKAIREATTYGLSIVVIYVLLGLAVTLLFGASALNALSTNAVFNIFFALLLVVFAASFFGAFELTLPSAWTNKIDQKSESTTGLLSIFLMAFTLALVSFSCTGPIIGFLLVAVSTQGSILAPTIGMLGFAIALAIPFTLFALFPSLLKSAPKSGGWMNTIKVILGFIELAFALKFLSVADLAYGWHLLDREVFLSIWIVIFGLLGAYLLGWIRFPHDDESHRTNVPQFFLALASLSFTVYMIPGLWGAPCKAISAFTPPINTQDFNLYGGSVEARFTDYEQGMAAAQAEGKPVIIDFTGFGCVNCRKMEAAVWSNPQVADMLNNQYVLISLYVDDKTPLPQPIEIAENGQQRTLRTVGDKWSYLQRTKFGANAQPFYVLLDDKGQPLAPSRSYDEDIAAYLQFLRQGLSSYIKF